MVNLERVRGFGVRFTLPYVVRFSGVWVLVTTLITVVFGITSFLVTADQLGEEGRRHLMAVLAIQTALMVLALLLLAVFNTHRVAGPLIGIRRALEDVKAGNLERELRFRRTDPHLEEIERAFNEMMASLRERAKVA
jgi:methyl-accepting chemotaxis protein